VSSNANGRDRELPCIGGQPRDFIAALDVKTGMATPWNPNASVTVRGLAVSGGIVYAGVVRGSTVYAGGRFIQISGRPQQGLAVFEP
jgi:trimeric autotransporter adhesin